MRKNLILLLTLARLSSAQQLASDKTIGQIEVVAT
jgi:hypothetical protein